MTQMELDFLAPRESSWRANWYDITPELRDRMDRLNKCESEGLTVTELSVAQAWLARYEHERTSLGLDTPLQSPPGSRLDVWTSGWGTNDDWGAPPTPPEKGKQYRRQQR